MYVWFWPILTSSYEPNCLFRRALSSTITNSHQEPVSGQACDPPDPFSLNILIAYSLHSLVIPIAYFSLSFGDPQCLFFAFFGDPHCLLFSFHW
jgi:hypothetical protein